MHYKLLYFCIISLLISCECPQYLDTDKEIIPNDFSKLVVINKNSDYRFIDLYSRKVQLAKGIENSLFSDLQYIKFPAGFSNFLLKSNDSIIYNSMIFLKKNNYYSLIFYGDSTNLQNILLEDIFPENSENALIRIADISDYSKIYVKILSSLPQPIEVNLSKNEITNLIPMASGIVSLQIFNFLTSELISSLENIQISSNTITNFLIAGDSIGIDVSVVKTHK